MSKVTSILACFAIVCTLANTAALANGDADDQPPPPPPPQTTPPPVTPPVDDVVVSSGGGGGDSGLLLLVLLGAVVLGVGPRVGANQVELGAPVILDDDVESGAATGKY